MMWILSFLVCAAFEGEDRCTAQLEPRFFDTIKECRSQEKLSRIGILTVLIRNGGTPVFLQSDCVKINDMRAG